MWTPALILSAITLISPAFTSALQLEVDHDHIQSKFKWDAIKYVYAFGDSYSFVQGTRGFANFR